MGSSASIPYLPVGATIWAPQYTAAKALHSNSSSMSGGAGGELSTLLARLCVGVLLNLLHLGDHSHLLGCMVDDSVVLVELGPVLELESSNPAIKTFFN